MNSLDQDVQQDQFCQFKSIHGYLVQKQLTDCEEDTLVKMLEKAEAGKHAHVKLNPPKGAKYESACLIYIPPG